MIEIFLIYASSHWKFWKPNWGCGTSDGRSFQNALVVLTERLWAVGSGRTEAPGVVLFRSFRRLLWRNFALEGAQGHSVFPRNVALVQLVHPRKACITEFDWFIMVHQDLKIFATFCNQRAFLILLFVFSVASNWNKLWSFPTKPQLDASAWDPWPTPLSAQGNG